MPPPRARRSATRQRRRGPKDALQLVAVSFLSVAVLVAVALAFSRERWLRGDRRAAWGLLAAVAAMVAAWAAVVASVTWW